MATRFALPGWELNAYSASREWHVWRAVYFAVWMTEMLHVRPDADAMTGQSQLAQLRYVVSSERLPAQRVVAQSSA